MNYVVNPNTNKRIQVGGPTYKKLIKQGVQFNSPDLAQPSFLPKSTTICEDYVINPNTGKKIKVNGATYKKLVKQGVQFKIKETRRSVKKRKTYEEAYEQEGHYEKMKVKKLKELLKEKGLSTVGRKKDLVQRLLDDRDSQNLEGLETLEEALNSHVVSDETGYEEPIGGACPIDVSAKKKKEKLKRLTPVKRRSVEKEPIPENVPSENISQLVQSEWKECFLCVEMAKKNEMMRCDTPECEGICKACFEKLDKAECPFCRTDVSSLYSPKGRKRQQERWKKAQRLFIEEKCALDFEIARSLQEALQGQDFSMAVQGAYNSNPQRTIERVKKQERIQKPKGIQYKKQEAKQVVRKR